jgi:hypothetical protein
VRNGIHSYGCCCTRAHPAPTDTTLVPSQTAGWGPAASAASAPPAVARTEAPLPRSVSWTRIMGVGPTGSRRAHDDVFVGQGGGPGLRTVESPLHAGGPRPRLPCGAWAWSLVSHARTVAHDESTQIDLLLPKKTGSMKPNATDRWNQPSPIHQGPMHASRTGNCSPRAQLPMPPCGGRRTRRRRFYDDIKKFLRTHHACPTDTVGPAGQPTHVARAGAASGAKSKKKNWFKS